MTRCLHKWCPMYRPHALHCFIADRRPAVKHGEIHLRIEVLKRWGIDSAECPQPHTKAHVNKIHGETGSRYFLVQIIRIHPGAIARVKALEIQLC